MHHAGLHEDAIGGKAYDIRLLLRFLPYLKPYRLKLAGIMLILPLETLCRIAQPLVLKYAIDTAIVPGELEKLLTPALIFISLLVLDSLLVWIEVYGLQSLGQRVMSDIRESIFRHLLRLPTEWFDRTATGGVVTRVTSDVEALGEMFAAGIITIAGDLLLLAGIVAVMLWMDPQLSLVTFTVLPPLIFCAWLFRRNMRQAFREVRARLGRMNGHLAELLGGMAVVQSFGREAGEKERFSALNREHMKANMPVVTWDATLYAVVEMFSSVAIALIIWYGGGQTVSGAITFGTLVAFIQYIEKFFGPIRDLSAKYGVMQGSMAALERIFLLLDEKTEEGQGAVFEGQGSRVKGQGAVIEFRNVSFFYRPGEPVIEDLSLSVRRGERVAIVGESGGGKTTLTRLITGMYALKQGAILLDGTDIQQIPLEELRKGISLVPQEAVIFAETIEFNICLGAPEARERVRLAAATVGADSFIEKLPDGYMTMLSERGGNLSAGERQLLSFARAVAFDPEILILDEATASVDSASEALIQEGVQRLLEGRTAIVIAHRLSTVRNADRIVVIKKGKIVEEGGHDELLTLKGEYSRLYCLQFHCA